MKENENENKPEKKTLITVPPLLCRGCQGRQSMIAVLSEEIDRQSAEIEELKRLAGVREQDEAGRLAA